MKMNSKINIYKAQNLHKLNYICYNKIQSVPKKNLVYKNVYHNSSNEIIPKSNYEFNKKHKHSQPKPILSERIKEIIQMKIKRSANLEE